MHEQEQLKRSGLITAAAAIALLLRLTKDIEWRSWSDVDNGRQLHSCIQRALNGDNTAARHTHRVPELLSLETGHRFESLT